MTVDERTILLCTREVEKHVSYYFSSPYPKIKLQNNHTHVWGSLKGDQVVADKLIFHFHATLTYPMMPLLTRCR